MKSTWLGKALRSESPPFGAPANPRGFADVRFIARSNEEGLIQFFGDPGQRSELNVQRTLRVLALSGGGAGGAFGAGALVGLSRAQQRPDFNIVTGVSTGALIAPFALLGPDWDQRLTDAFVGIQASELLSLRGLRPGPGLFAGEPLALLVQRYVDERLVAAVAEAHKAGRRLFVATANLDSQTTSIWDLGAIACIRGADGVALFANVLIASASLPGVFPPRMIEVESEGETFAEMHIDGGAITPLFVAPEALIHHRSRAWAGRAVEIHALFNTSLEPCPQTTPFEAIPILVRSFELMLRSSYRAALTSVAAFCELNDFGLHVASVQADRAAGALLRFDQQGMTEMFNHGADTAQAGRLWSSQALNPG